MEIDTLPRLRVFRVLGLCAAPKLDRSLPTMEVGPTLEL